MKSTMSYLNQMNLNGNLILLNLPEGCELGLDYKIFRIGKKFKGINHIPIGLHFLFCSNRTNSNDNGIPHGFFFNINESNENIQIFQWLQDIEIIGLPKLNIHRDHLKLAVKNNEFLENLGPYPKENYSIWYYLSNFIDLQVLKICGLDILCPISGGDYEEPEKKENNKKIVPFFKNILRTPQFTNISYNKVTLSKLNDPKKITENFKDTSKLLQDILVNIYKNKEKYLLGELQLSFILFHTLYSFSALEQWKKIIWLICSAEKIYKTHPNLYLNFFNVLETQLSQIPEDFFMDELSKNNFLKNSLASIFEILNGLDTDSKLLDALTNLQKFLRKRFSFEIEIYGSFAFTDDEYAPTIVES